MIATVQKWGNSLGIRIPKPLAQDAAMREGVSVEMSVEEGRLILVPQKARRYQLGTLLKAISAKNIHAEVDTGEATGKEAW